MNGTYETENFIFENGDVYLTIRGKGDRSGESVSIPKPEFGKALVGLEIVQMATVRFQKEQAKSVVEKTVNACLRSDETSIPETAVVGA